MAFRAVNAAMGLLFVVATVVQYNDPDPILWMALYGASAVLSFWTAAQPGGCPWWVPAVVAAIAIVWSAVIGSGVDRSVRLADLVRAWHMDDVKVEEARETLGLLIVASWMAVLSVAAFRHKG